MIEVTRLNGNPMLVNSDLIKSAEASPDTVLTLIHGDKLMIRESPAEIVEKIIAYRARLLASLTALGGQHDLYRAVALASHNPETGKPPVSRGGAAITGAGMTGSAMTGAAANSGPTLVVADNHSSEAAL